MYIAKDWHGINLLFLLVVVVVVVIIVENRKVY